MKRNDTSGVHLWLILMKAHKALLDISMADISRSGLCFSEFEILEVLLNKGPLPVNTVGERAFRTSGSSTAAVDRLERRGLVRRAVHSMTTKPRSSSHTKGPQTDLWNFRRDMLPSWKPPLKISRKQNARV